MTRVAVVLFAVVITGCASRSASVTNPPPLAEVGTSIYATLTFNDSDLIREDQLILRNGLQEALRDYHVPVQLSSPAESGGYSFIISMIIRKPAYEVDKDLLEYYISLAFEGNRISVTPASVTFSEISYNAAIHKAALFIKTSRQFFEELRRIL
jgi:hypothetical protein